MRAGVLLAAGASRRFGEDDKLLAPLDGQPLVLHAARTLLAAPLDRRFAVVSSPSVRDLLRGAELEVVEIAPGQGQAASLVAAVSHLRDETHLLVTLGDMPFLRPEHLRPLLEGPADVPHAALGASLSPPAIFPRSWFDRLAALTGDQGAGRLLRELPSTSHHSLPPEALRDIDTRGDLMLAAAPAGSDAPSTP